MSSNLKRAMIRLARDREELLRSPVANVSAAPLDSNILEWHCNIRHQDDLYHLILFFPNDYPCKPPSAEFVPQGLEYLGGASSQGKKGTNICLSIFSDYAQLHSEWANAMNDGWSPGYTVQTVLLTLLADIQGSNNYRYSDSYRNKCRQFVCSDCGHTFQKPFPPLEEERGVGEEEEPKPAQTEDLELSIQAKSVIDNGYLETPRIVDYFSKETLSLMKSEASIEQQMFGFGFSVSGTDHKPKLTCPCEYLTLSSFKQMESTLGHAQTVHKERLSHFMPLYINDQHGRKIREQFEDTMRKLAPKFSLDFEESPEDVILEVIPRLMCSTVAHISKGTVRTTDKSMEGFFALHRLFLSAMDSYPGLEREVERRLANFLRYPKSRSKQYCPIMGKWLMYLSVCGKHSWENIATAYLKETFNRNVKWYLKTEPDLADMNTPVDIRLQRTFELTQGNCKLLASEVSFLKIAKPAGMRRGDILRRYDNNQGLPTPEMVAQLKELLDRIKNNIKRYDHWYRALDVPVPTKAQLHKTLMESIKFASSKWGYH